MTHRYETIAQDNEWFAFYALASILAVTVRIRNCITVVIQAIVSHLTCQICHMCNIHM